MTPYAVGVEPGQSRWLGWVLVLSVALMAFAQRGFAEELPINFDIPAQPLAGALEAFSAASGYQILMAEPGSEKIPANAVKGILSPDEALSRMILGTGLQVRRTGDRSAIVVHDDHVAPKFSSARKDERDYDAVLQNTVMGVLCQDAVTRPGQYRAAFDVWVTSFGGIERTDLLSSTGDPVRDRRIVAILRGLRPGPPPPGVAQPTTMLVLPGSTAVQACETALAGRKVTTP